MGGKTGNKAGYFDKLKGLLEEYKSIFIVTVDNVSSQQMHNIRKSLRGNAVVLMGKNTMVYKSFAQESRSDQCRFVAPFEHLLPIILSTNVFFHTSRVCDLN